MRNKISFIFFSFQFISIFSSKVPFLFELNIDSVKEKFNCNKRICKKITDGCKISSLDSKLHLIKCNETQMHLRSHIFSPPSMRRTFFISIVDVAILHFNLERFL